MRAPFLVLVLCFCFFMHADNAGSTGTYNLSTFWQNRVNKMRDGSVSSLAEGPAAWGGFRPVYVNDGITSADWYGVTNSDPAALNNGRGLAVTFTSSLALRQMVLWAYAWPTFNFVVEYWNGSSWAAVATIPNVGGNPRVLNFNADGDISSTQWRWYISDWNTPGSNYYAYEFEAYL